MKRIEKPVAVINQMIKDEIIENYVLDKQTAVLWNALEAMVQEV